MIRRMRWGVRRSYLNPDGSLMSGLVAHILLRVLHIGLVITEGPATTESTVEPTSQRSGFFGAQKGIKKYPDMLRVTYPTPKPTRNSTTSMLQESRLHVEPNPANSETRTSKTLDQCTTSAHDDIS